MVRARVRKHLINLKSRFSSLADAKILVLPGRDYGFRLIMPKAVWVEVLKEMAEVSANAATATSPKAGTDEVALIDQFEDFVKKGS